MLLEKNNEDISLKKFNNSKEKIREGNINNNKKDTRLADIKKQRLVILY